MDKELKEVLEQNQEQIKENSADINEDMNDVRGYLLHIEEKLDLLIEKYESMGV